MGLSKDLTDAFNKNGTDTAYMIPDYALSLFVENVLKAHHEMIQAAACHVEEGTPLHPQDAALSVLLKDAAHTLRHVIKVAAEGERRAPPNTAMAAEKQLARVKDAADRGWAMVDRLLNAAVEIDMRKNVQSAIVTAGRPAEEPKVL